MDIVDAQFHYGPGGIDQALAMMDALGIASAVIDEFWIGEWNGYPGYRLPNGVFRVTQPTIELAAILHPTRFTSLLRVDRRDPEVSSLIRLAGQAPHVKAIRIIGPGMEKPEGDAFVAGDYAELFAATERAGLPLFVFAPRQLEAIARYAREFPGLRVIVDHCGMLSNGMRRFLAGYEGVSGGPDAQLADFEQVLRLADVPNIALKWVHAASVFELPPYPGEKVWPILRRAVDAFGAERVMWGSDASVVHTGECWGEILFSLRANTELSEAETAAVLGGSIRKWLDWPA
ncbi:amidohydrolase family protein [Flavisphingomonas formosensis]|uniref:amidohydrolase family protein n=1 Tax=Flavisphingomonas formosensis TaxID=861534 RepID=UPI0012FB1B0D|nr:amidohydrolase family protein [Sphingomonas formosensis]